MYDMSGSEYLELYHGTQVGLIHSIRAKGLVSGFLTNSREVAERFTHKYVPGNRLLVICRVPKTLLSKYLVIIDLGDPTICHYRVAETLPPAVIHDTEHVA